MANSLSRDYLFGIKNAIPYGNMGNCYNLLCWKEQGDFGVLFVQLKKEKGSHTALEREDVFQD